LNKLATTDSALVILLAGMDFAVFDHVLRGANWTSG